MPPNTVSVCRPGKWGNPFIIGQLIGDAWGHSHYVKDAETAVSLFQHDLVNDVLLHDPDFLEPLRGRNLACWCRLDAPCHADVLLRLANQ